MIVHLCDGCGTQCLQTEIQPVGDLDPVMYCASCREKWAGVQAELDKARVQAIALYGEIRGTLLAGARSALSKLPDDEAA